MILSIDGLTLPASTASKSDIFTQVTSQRTVGGRLVTRYGYQKYRCTFKLPDATTMSLDYQAQFYAKCTKAKTQAVDVTFIDHMTNGQKTLSMKCTDMQSPDVMALFNRTPSAYTGIEATFEQV